MTPEEIAEYCDQLWNALVHGHQWGNDYAMQIIGVALAAKLKERPLG